MKKIIAFTAIFTTVVLIAAACNNSKGITYDAPGALEVSLPVVGVPGTILDSEKLDLGEGVIGYRILYASESLSDNKPIAVSGYVVTKSGTPPAAGWPLVAWAHGTTGLADKCAPSAEVETDTALWKGLLDAGYAVVATDYEGLGTPGLHPYIVGESEARGVFDSVRAVQRHGNALPGISVSDKWVVWGHSQGGHAAIFTAEIWKDYASELNLVGAVVGAPPSQFSLLYGALLGGPFQGYIAMSMAGAAESYSLDLNDFLAQEALDRIGVLETGCVAEVFEQYNSLTKEQLSQHSNPLAVEPLKSIIVKMDPATLPIQTPTLIIHGEADEQIPSISSLFLLKQQCAKLKGAIPLKRLTYAGKDHTSVIEASWDDMLTWINDRFEGKKAAPTGC